jgi:polyphosphate kinase
MRYFNRDISWLGFNGRVLDEAANKEVPIYERVKFLSIFSSNLDEFFRVRYPALKTQERMRDGNDTLQEAQGIINGQLARFGSILMDTILPELRGYDVHLYYRELIAAEHTAFATDYFYTQLLSFLQPVVLDNATERVELQNNKLYFIATLTDAAGNDSYGVVNIPDDNLSRCVVVPSTGSETHILFLDDILRHNIHKVFSGYKVQSCYSIKLTRNADIDIADEWSDVFEEKVLEMIRNREKGVPTRLLYETGMPHPVIDFVQAYFKVSPDSMIAGGRYHNLKDLVKLPNPIGASVLYKAQPPCNHKALHAYTSVFDAMDAGDNLLHFPYHSYSSILRFFNEAAIDPLVEEVSVTLYRVAHDSFITNALISAARNGKKVTAFVELKARFDEANNLAWATRMKAAGVRILYSIPGMKVHAKVALVKKRAAIGSTYYGLLSTGNFNEGTARFYTDHILLTTDKDITREMDLLFAYLQARQQPKEYPFIKFNNLLVAGFNFYERLQYLVEREIIHKQQGKEAAITIKLNNLQEPNAIELLYKASNAGVTVHLLVRGICCLIPGVAGMSGHITVKKLIGRYLEHSRIYIFHNGGDEEVYSGSADLMTRNIHRRIEVIFPVKDAAIKQQLKDMVALQWKDNVQSVTLQSNGTLLPVQNNEPPTNAQDIMYEYVCHL